MAGLRISRAAVLWLAASPLVLSSFAFPQLSALASCRRAFYRQEYVKAAQIAETRLRTRPHDLPVRVMLARVELAQGRFRPAFEQLLKVLTSDPRNVDALYYLSFAARGLSQQEYQRLFAMAPDSSRVHQLLAEAALQAENPTEAEAQFLKALQNNPRSGEIATELAELKRSQSKFDEAIQYYTKAENAGHLTYEIAYGLGACYTYKQEYAQATNWLRRAVNLDPKSVAAHFALGNSYFQTGDFNAAIPQLLTAVGYEPNMKQAYFLLGRAYTKLGQRQKAAAAFKKLDELSTSAVPTPGSDAAVDTKSDNSGHSRHH